MDIADRANSYNRAFPNYPDLYLVNQKRLEGIWYIGKAMFRKGGYYGEYPTNYLDRVYSLFPDCDRILHLFSGIVKGRGGVTFDINPDLKPDVCGDVMELERHFPNPKFDLVIADPPYEPKDFQIYGTRPFSKREAIRKIHKILVDGGFLVWLDLMVPPFSNALWKWVGLIAVTTGTNCRIRALTILEHHS